MTAAATIDTDLLDSTPPAGKTRSFETLLALVVAAANDHAASIDTLNGNIGGTLTADAPGRAKMATGFFTEAKATDAFAALAIDGALLKQKATRLGAPTIALAAIASRTITATITLKDIAGIALAAAAYAKVWVSATAGGVPAATPPSSATVIGGGTLLKALTADVLYDVISSAAGAITVAVTEAATKNFYVNVAVGGFVVSSAALVFP